MIKYFCDGCGEELTNQNRTCRNTNGRLFGFSGKIGFEIITALNKTWNAGEFCDSCILKAINKTFGEKGRKE